MSLFKKKKNIPTEEDLNRTVDKLKDISDNLKETVSQLQEQLTRLKIIEELQSRQGES